jgi:tetratricopeptide (TPR) repeat protein
MELRENNPLVLEILKQDKTLKMSLFEQQEATSTLRHFSSCVVSANEIERFCHEIVFILNRSGSARLADSDLVQGLKKAGQLLWDHLLTAQVKSRLKSTDIADLVLSIDEELINIPWELLFDGTNFLCLNFNLGRVVRTREQSSAVRYRSCQDTLKMMILANPTNDLISAYQEGIAIKNQFDRRRSNVRIDFKSTYIDRLYVKKNLRDYDIIHYAGHCEYAQDNPRNCGWVLSDGKFGVTDILALGTDESLPSLVFSNGCYSAKAMPNCLDEDYQEKNFCLAQAFLFSGVRHYIGAIRKIEDPVSLDFSKEFYTNLISGKPVGESIRLSRLKLIKEHGISNIAWASYILYGDPKFTLLRQSTKKPKLSKVNLVTKRNLVFASVAAGVVASVIFLASFLSSLNPSAHFIFLRSQRLYQKGDNAAAIELAESILKKDPLFLAAYPLIADSFQRQGDRDSALKFYFDYAVSSEKKNDPKQLASAYNSIGWCYHLQGNYEKANEFYQKALSLSRKANDKLNEAVALRKLAVWFMDKSDYDRSLELLTKSSEINRSRFSSAEHRYNLACDYFDLGLVFENKEDYAAAKDFYEKSRGIFDKLKLKDELSDYYFNLGEMCVFEKEYQKALDYYSKGLAIDKAHNNLANLGSDFNMMGELYAQMDNELEAEKFFNQAVEVSLKINARPELAASYQNLGLLYKKLGKKHKAREYLRQAQEIYSQIDKDSYEEVKKEILALSSE